MLVHLRVLPTFEDVVKHGVDYAVPPLLLDGLCTFEVLA